MPKINQEIQSFARIMVIGIGGSGKNAVNHMINSKVKNQNFNFRLGSFCFVFCVLILVLLPNLSIFQSFNLSIPLHLLCFPLLPQNQHRAGDEDGGICAYDNPNKQRKDKIFNRFAAK